MSGTAKAPRHKRTLKGVSNSAPLRKTAHGPTGAEVSPSSGAKLELLPSVLGLVQRRVWTNDRHNEFDNASLEARKDGRHLDELEAERGMLAAYHREQALIELAKSIPARTLGDAAAHIVMAYQVAGDLETNDNEGYELELLRRQLCRCLSSALRVVADTAGVPIETIGGDWMAGAFDRDFPDLGDRA
ncbi:hypothetical protein [Acidisoma silvae]|uniref:Uncharacterized protein n=1 Tax=Acidisoma silvae TaxID=2802396 RepID=A0A963YXQ2_9PROT|nr:hypothetical protein [Acidisoma silvae]MCB8878262.1 hypothetical protein [Acidisoma silvae]